MSRDTISSLEAIQSMLTAGHRNICLRPHTLFLWGIAGGVLCLSMDSILTPQRFPEVWLRHLALLFLLTVVLSGVALADYGITHYRLRERDESLSFVQAQITKVWWLLIGMGVLFSFATGIYGGGAMVYGIWLLLIGVGLYVHGLFSERTLEWAGLLFIALGVGALLPQVCYLPAKWLAASAFGLGMPALGLILDRGAAGGSKVRLLRLGAWLCAVLALAAIGFLVFDRTPAPSEMNPNERVLDFPAGTMVPLKIKMVSPVLRMDSEAELPMTLLQPLQVALTGGKADGRFQLQDQGWQRMPYDLHIRIDGFAAEFVPGKSPAVIVDMRVDSKP